MFGKKKRRIQALEAENAELKAENAALRADNAELKAEIEKRDNSPSYAQIVNEWINGEEAEDG